MTQLTEEQRLIKLAECETSKDFYSLYEFVFKEEVPETLLRDPDEIIEKIIIAISDNEKIKGVVLSENVYI
tara:strand:+ start:946 stop:1158 length:213 start_codon:yes stop_codon:yes gene_type:complete